MERRAQAVYVAGDGTLVGRGQCWLLVDAPLVRVPVERLWALLAQRHPARTTGDAVLALLELHFDGDLPSLVLLDQTPGAEEVVVRGRGQVAARAGVRFAAVGLPAGGQRLPLVEGVVAASGVELAATTAEPGHQPGTLPVPRPAAVPARRPIPGPAAASTPLRRGAPRVLPPRMGGPVRSALPAAPAPPEVPALATRSSVLAWRCPAGHLSPAHAPTCRVCGTAVPEQPPVAMPRPRLGGLRLPGGQVIPLDRGVVFGRKPEPVPGGEDWPHLVHLPVGPTYLSRLHLQIELDGWAVIARDLDSRGGTTVRSPGRAAQRLLPQEPHVLEPGQVLTLSDDYEVVFEADADDPGQARALRRTSR